MKLYTLEREQLEDFADEVKVSVMTGLVNGGHVDQAFADEWCATHTVALTKKTLWRTISDRWRHTKDSTGLVLTLVGVPSRADRKEAGQA